MESLKNSHSYELLAVGLGALSTASRLAFGTGRRLKNDFLSVFAITAPPSEPPKNYRFRETVKFKRVAIANAEVAAAALKYAVNGIGTKLAPQFRHRKVSQPMQILSLLRPDVAHSHAPLLFSGLSYDFRIGSCLLALRDLRKLSTSSGATC